MMANRAAVFAAAGCVLVLACSNDLDCSLNGVCNAGACDCRPGWVGGDCSALKIATVNASSGRNGLPVSSSWGGNALLVDGVYHLFYSVRRLLGPASTSPFTLRGSQRIIGDNCTLNQWETNSACWRATSLNPAGPFVDAEQVMGAFCHNTVPARAPDGTILVFHIGYGGGTPVKCSASAVAARGGLPWGAPMLLYAPSVTGPWQQLGPLLVGTPGAWDATITNASPWILPNGSVLLAFRGSSPNHTELLGVAAAPSWRGPYAKSVAGPILAQEGEDPFPFVDSAGESERIVVEAGVTVSRFAILLRRGDSKSLAPHPQVPSTFSSTTSMRSSTAVMPLLHSGRAPGTTPAPPRTTAASRGLGAPDFRRRSRDGSGRWSISTPHPGRRVCCLTARRPAPAAQASRWPPWCCLPTSLQGVVHACF